MKKILNLIFRIKDGHFKSCPYKFPKSIDIEPICECEERRYKAVLIIGLNMFALEFLGGILTNSLSLLGDSLHLFANSMAIIAAIWIAKMSAKHKAQEGILRQAGVLFNGSLLLLISAYLLYASFCKFLSPSGTAGFYMLLIAKIGIWGNFLQRYILVSVTGDSRKIDLLQSFAVVLGGVCIVFVSDTRISFLIDPFVSAGIGFTMARDSLKLIYKL